MPFNRLSIAAVAVAAVVVAAPVAIAVESQVRTFVVSEDYHTPNEASFTSKAAIVKFTGRTSQVTGRTVIPIADVAKASGAIKVDLKSLDTGIALRNEHMRGTIEAEKYPVATFQVKSIQVPGNQLKPNAAVAGTVTGQMTLHGVTRTLTAPVELVYLPEQDANYRAGDWVQITSSFKLKLSDYQIPLPKPVMGIKVADELAIDFTSMAKAQ